MSPKGFAAQQLQDILVAGRHAKMEDVAARPDTPRPHSEMPRPYSPPSPPDTNSSATMSPVYPDRPIRPLPKRSLRARLSPEVAEQINADQVLPATGALLNIPISELMTERNAGAIKSAIREIDQAIIEAQDDCGEGCRAMHRDRSTFAVPSMFSEVDSDDEDGLSMIRRYEEYKARRAAAGPGVTQRMIFDAERMSQSIASSNESVDGYDSFENTNNKKKRKIPTSGGMGGHHPSLSASLSSEMANMGISSSRDAGTSLDSPTDGVGQYYGSGNSAMPAPSPGTGISGAGRGRYGRSKRDTSGRSPLSASTANAAPAWGMGRPRFREYTPTGKLPQAPTESGIISAAIAEAAVLPATAPKGQENVSLLEQQTAKKATPTKTQFTFTCEPESTKGVVWPGDPNSSLPTAHHQGRETQAPTATPYPAVQRGFSTQGTQTSPTMAGQQAPNNSSAPPAAAQPAQQPPPPRKPRRSAAKRYEMAERERRLQQEYNNYHHPPREDDIWICEFCEYESIFGVRPVALIRQYEIKDRRERKRLAEKRRLLEKAKMKGRKGKKGSKNAAKNNAAAQPQHTTAAAAAPQHSHILPSSESTPTQTHGGGQDEFYGETYEDEAPIQAPMPPETPTRIPQPITPNYGQSPRIAHSSGVPATRAN